MTPESIAADIEAAMDDWTGQAVPHLTDIVPLAIGRGIADDADLVFAATVVDGQVHCGLVAGCSLLVGANVRWAMIRYCAEDRDRAERFLERLRNRVVDDLQDDETTFVAMRGPDPNWRTFRGERLQTFDEVRVRRSSEMN